MYTEHTTASDSISNDFLFDVVFPLLVTMSQQSHVGRRNSDLSLRCQRNRDLGFR